MKRQQSGFTLIEILVVLMIVSVLASVAVIAVRGHDSQAVIDDSVRMLAYSLQVAEEETLFRRRTLGLLVSVDGYQFLLKDPEGWYLMRDRFFKSRSFPEKLEVTFYVDGTPQTLEKMTVDSETKLVPQVVFVPDSEPVPFEMLFNYAGLKERKLERTPTGRIVTTLGEQP